MKPPDPAAASFDLGPSAVENGLLRFSHQAMATVFEVHCVHANARYVGEAARAAFDLVDGLEQQLSRFIPNSDISRINHLTPGESTRVSPSTMECLTIAQYLHDLTLTTFDVALGSGLTNLELAPEDLSVRVRGEGLSLDLGGIGKGYAVDRMAALLEEWEIPHALVHGGFSSVLALEAPPGRDGWPLTMSAPGESQVLESLSARFLALGASGIRRTDHILDPRSLRPVKSRAAAWVALGAGSECRRNGLHPATVADALSTAFMILDEEEVGNICERHTGVSAWLLPGRKKDTEGPPELRRLGGVLLPRGTKEGG